ncbi:SusD/RagB family nutrient-binding outer membrane lipoprotein [Mangrovibacterium marinum]|uniref:SusD/RagB-like outer membrane lipoprotein n=1 Tax=Mangrovibacterium marinum TaxID=1639118 RepID=A0A2T5C542_9BACT|nr:SusD/RagB family nutrient-binding outer membrane lipoprotein [Mangrovibacterium marinum]PTN09957.1 SusD/RagB-like outer membrane lipoprotein [Mangrovibacterium marinum]
MNYKKIAVYMSMAAALLTTNACQDKFADINTDPASITNGDVNYLFTQALINFEPSDYTFWYYNAPMMYKWGEIGIGTTGFNSTYQETTEYGGQGQQTYQVLRYVRDFEYQLEQMSAEEAAGYQQQLAALRTLTIYLGIFDTDMYGDMPFNEACLARYTSPSLLTPAYDTVESLYSQWLEELDTYVTTLTTATDQNWIAKQDLIYGGDAAKWAKLANSLRLKIAVRLLSQDKTKALQVAKTVAESPAGVLNGTDDDFVFNKATAVSDNDGDKVYHFGNNVLSSLAPTQLVSEFMLDNQDPRIRFFFSKNDYNSKVVQAFFDQDIELPDFIADNVEYTEDANGNKTFSNWKGLGEPWVRYYGLPMVMNANQDGTYDGYFKTSPYTLKNSEGSEYTYEATSRFNEELVRGRLDYTIPAAPEDVPVTDSQDNPWWGMYMSTAEVNFYFAELALLGADLPNTAEAYYNAAVEASVQEYDRLASLNQIPYYGKTYGYDPNEKVIDLQDGEIETMMTMPDVAFSGSTAEKLEKIYVQEILHFMFAPSDQFNVIRRSGIPARNSSMFAWTDFQEPSYTQIPRRFEVSTPSVTDLMYDIKVEAYSNQGFTSGTSIPTNLLNTERVWQDEGAPNFGEGPNAQ